MPTTNGFRDHQLEVEKNILMDVICHFYDDWITPILPHAISDKPKTSSSPSTSSEDNSRFFIDNPSRSVSRSFFANSRPFSF